MYQNDTYFCHGYNSTTHVSVVYTFVPECISQVHEWKKSSHGRNNLNISIVCNALGVDCSHLRE